MASLELLSAALGKRAAALGAGSCGHGLACEDGEKCLSNRSFMTKTLQLLSSNNRVSNSVEFDPHKEPLGALQVKQNLAKSPCHA